MHCRSAMRATVASLAEAGAAIAALEAQQARHAESEDFEAAAAVDGKLKEAGQQRDLLQVGTVVGKDEVGRAFTHRPMALSALPRRT